MFKNIDDIEKTRIEAGKDASIQVLLDSDMMPNFSMRKFTLEPGGYIPFHTNSLEHEQYVLNGNGKIVLGSEVKEVTAGSIVYMPKGVPHSYENIGTEPFEFLCMVPNQDDTIEFIDEEKQS